MNTTENNSDLIISIPCVGKTRFNYRVLRVYEDRLLMYNSDKGEIIFDEKYSDMVSLTHKKKSSFLRCLMVLEMKDGTKYDVTLDDRHTLSGKYTKYSNPEINQLSKTLPGFINKRIAQSQAGC